MLLLTTHYSLLMNETLNEKLFSIEFSRDYSDSNEDDNDDRNSSKGYSDSDQDNDVMCISDSNDSKELTPYTTVLIEELPPFTKEQDIMKLFSSYPLVHIVMAKRSKVFTAYAKFHSADDAKAAVKNTACHRISFKTVYISPCSEGEFEMARKEFSGELDLDIGAGKSNESNQSPSDDINKTISEQLPNGNGLDNDNSTDYMNDDSPNHSSNRIPEISLESIPGVNLADPRINTAKFPFLSNMNQTNTEPSKPIVERVDPRMKSSIQTPLAAMNAFSSMDMSQASVMDPNTIEVCCIFIENMEYRTTESEITEWISDQIDITPLRIQLLVNDRNQTNGNGFVQFLNAEQATKAVEKLDKCQFKTRFVHVSLAPWQQIQITIAQITQVLRENGFDGIDTSGNIPRSRNNNGGNNKFNTNNNRYNSSHNNRMSNNRPHHRNSNGNGNGNSNNNNSNFNGCVVAMSNVPYKASTEDILEFFYDFDITPNDIIRRYNDEGKPTGDARVRFETPAEARRAIDLRDNCRILNRSIYLTLV